MLDVLGQLAGEFLGEFLGDIVEGIGEVGGEIGGNISSGISENIHEAGGVIGGVIGGVAGHNLRPPSNYSPPSTDYSNYGASQSNEDAGFASFLLLLAFLSPFVLVLFMFINF